MKRVLVLAAVGEAATGVALLIAPSLVGWLLFGEELVGVALPVARPCMGLLASVRPGLTECYLSDASENAA